MCIAFASLVPLSMYVRAHVQARTAEFPENIAHAVELSVASLQEVLTRTKTYVSLSLILSHLLRTHMRMHMCLGESCVQSGLTDQLCLYDLRLFPALCVDHLMYTAPPMRLAGTRCLRLRPVPSESSDWCSPSMPSSLPPLCIALSQHFPVDIIDSYVYIHTYIDSYLRVHIDAFTHTHTHTYDVTITCTQTPRRDMYQ